MGMAISVPRYTVEDLERFPEDGNRYELLDGVLLVTPGPGSAHQEIATRLLLALGPVVHSTGLGHLAASGTVSLPPLTLLEPDLLVYPARFAPGTPWPDITEHWLAVEVLSRGSRTYDREFKRDAYLAIGVREVWLVDQRDKSVEVCRARGAGMVVTDAFTWTVADAGISVVIDVRALFEGLL